MLQGVFCANYWAKRGHWERCNGIWCGGCFEPAGDDEFPMRIPLDDGGQPIFLDAKDEGRFVVARGGDHLFTRFQCGPCHFRNIQGRDPIPGDGADALMVKCIRRATLDAFWSREAGTIRGSRSSMKATFRCANMVRGLGIFPRLGPFPLRDVDGMGSAVVQLLKTLDPGKNEKYVQYETAKNVRTVLGAIWEVSVESKDQTVIVQDMTKSFLTTSPTKSQWFSRFMVGMHKRMGDLTKQDEAISVELMVALMDEFEKDWGLVNRDRLATDGEVAEVLFPALFAVTAFCGALRGEEVPLMDFGATKEFTAAGLATAMEERRHGVIALHGRFKNEIGEKCHLMPIAQVTDSGLMPVKWMNRMIAYYDARGIDSGPVFRTWEGKRARQGQFELSILNRLVRLETEKPSLFPDKTVNVMSDYSTRRSFRRGATTRAEILGLPGTVTDLNNRWRSVENAKGKKVNHSSMRGYYSGIRLLLVPLLKFSQAM
jgi:hypothetical protein